MVEGVRMPICFTPSPAMARAMRAPLYSATPKYTQQHQEGDARAYAEFLARRDGVEIPLETATRGSQYSRHNGVLVQFESGWLESTNRRRTRAVIWELGSWSEYRDVQRTHEGKPVMVSERCQPYWTAEKVLLRIEIPNWDHVATVAECNQQELAA